jgi:hypothetical protein
MLFVELGLLPIERFSQSPGVESVASPPRHSTEQQHKLARNGLLELVDTEIQAEQLLPELRGMKEQLQHGVHVAGAA